MNAIKVESLKVDQTFTHEVVLDKGFILMVPGQPVTRELLKALQIWNFDQVQSEGSVGQPPVEITDTTSADDFMEEQNKAAEQENSGPKLNTNVKEALEKIQIGGNEKTRLNAVLNIYNEYISYINSVYTRYATHEDLDLDQLSDTVKDLCVFVKENRRFVLRISPTIETRNKNYLVIHAMRSTVFAIVIGLRLHLDFTKLVELGVACILHEIGMLQLPSYLYLSDKRFTNAERARIATHPLLGYKILSSANFPVSIQRGILEHHEREDGTGYPQNLTGEKISQYAKIISVCCSYEAISSPRNFREARTTYDAMVEMLKNQNSKYNGDVIKALLYSLSVFPIGAYVYLANGKLGQVCDVNPDNPKNPIVQILGEKAADGDPRTIQTDDSMNKIVRILNKKEVEDALKFIESKENQ
ncbi:MAG: HD-GYP domain-containing protein [Treponema sp.]|nr:HD-GYP domain-containing protein [Treponema sp.]